MTANALLSQVRTTPHKIDFSQVMQVITELYNYTPTTFTNGELTNAAGSNEGSCKIFFFAQLNGLDETETLALFGSFYRDDVLANPEGQDHGNIRNFMQKGWAGIQFEGEALVAKA